MSKLWLVLDLEGEILAQVVAPSHPRWHGFAWESGKMRATEVERHGDLGFERWNGSNWEPTKALDAFLLGQIDAAAGEVRARLLTMAPGQEAVYRAKLAEAEQLVDRGSLPASSIPILAAEAKATGLPVRTLAGDVLERAEEWHQKAAPIEAKRIAAKRAVREASTREDKIEAARVRW